LTDPQTAAKSLQQRIKSISRSRRFVSHAESGELAREISRIGSDVRADVLPKDPKRAMALAEKLVLLDDAVFDRADDSSGVIGAEFQEACVLWLDAAAAVRGADDSQGTAWSKALHELYRSDGYGIREPLLTEAHRLFVRRICGFLGFDLECLRA
jgi:hypothetical protein